MDTFLQQLFNLLTNPPGNLVYHLVLTFSVTAAIQVVFVGRHNLSSSQVNRLLVAFGVLLVGQLALFLGSGLAWQGLLNPRDILPPLDRAVTLLSMLWTAWLWAFPDHNRAGDIGAIILSLAVVILCIFTLTSWSIVTAFMPFNASWLDWLWGLSTIVILLGGLLLLTLRRPDYWEAGLAVLGINLIGQVIHLTLAVPAGDFAPIVRLAHICSFPLLPLVSRRLQPAAPLSLPPQTSTSRQQANLSPENLLVLLHSDPKREPTVMYKVVTRSIAEFAPADLCLLVTQPTSDGEIILESGYDQVHQQEIAQTILKRVDMPALTSALQAGQPQRIQPGPATTPEILALGKIAGYHTAAEMLVLPFAIAMGETAGIVLVSSHSNQAWTESDTARLSKFSTLLLQLVQQARQTSPEQVDSLHLKDELESARQQIEQLRQEKQELGNKFNELRKDILFLGAQVDLNQDSEQVESDEPAVTPLAAGKGDKVLHLWLEQAQQENKELSDELQRLQREKQELNEKIKSLHDGKPTGIPASPSYREINQEFDASVSQILIHKQQLDIILEDLETRGQGIEGSLEKIRSVYQTLRNLVEIFRQQHQNIRNEVENQFAATTPEPDIDLSDASLSGLLHSENFEAELELLLNEKKYAPETAAPPEKSASSQHLSLPTFEEKLPVDKTQPVRVKPKPGAKPSAVQERTQEIATAHAVPHEAETVLSSHADTIHKSVNVPGNERLQALFENLNDTRGNAAEIIDSLEEEHKSLNGLLEKLLNNENEMRLLSSDLQFIHDRFDAALLNMYSIQKKDQKVGIELRSQLEQSQAQVKLSEDDRNALQKEAEEARGENEQLQLAAQAAQEENQQLVDALQKENEQLNAKIEEALKQISDTAADLEKRQSDVRLSMEEVARLESTLTDTKLKLQSLDEQYKQHQFTTTDTSKKVAGLTQDLLQPVASINGYIDLLRSETVGLVGAVQSRFLERIKASTEKMNELLTRLAEITTKEIEAEEIAPQPADLNRIIDEAVAETRSRRDEKKIDLQVSMPEETLSLFVEPDALEQIVINLLENASAVTPSGGKISLGVQVKAGEPEKSGLLLEIADGGDGIPPEELPEIFSIQKEENINLSIAKTLVEAQGGHIWVDSQPGQGSTFNVLLPLPQDAGGNPSPS